MVAALHHDDVISLGVRASDLDRCLNGLTTGVPEEERVEALVRHHRQERLHQLYIWLRQGDGALNVDDRLGLSNDRSGDIGMRVTERRDSDTRSEI